MTTLYVDADGCPVKDEAYLVTKRHGVPVVVVANAWLRVPDDPRIRFQQVAAGPDAADDWIVETAAPGDVAVTTDIPLAARLIKNDVRVVNPRGKEMTEDDVGDALAKREILAFLRETGDFGGGPAPLSDRDRSRFKQTLHQVLERAARARRPR